MTHLDLDQLLALREPGSEPGGAAARRHLDECAACREELSRLDQRVARLRALPPLRPSRDGWPAVQARLAADRRGRRTRRAAWAALGGLGLAAGLAGFLVLPGSEPEATLAFEAAPAVQAELEDVQERSRLLEAALRAYGPESRVVDGRTDGFAEQLEIRIADLDRRLDITELSDDAARDAQLLRLWQERVGLLDALVDVHLTSASNVGL